MKITAKQLFESSDALKVLAHTKGLPARISYRLGKMLRKAEQELTELNSTRLKLFMEFGEESPKDSGNWVVKDDSFNRPAFNEQLEALLTEQIELPLDVPLSIGDLGEKMDPVPPPSTFLALDWLVWD